MVMLSVTLNFAMFCRCLSQPCSRSTGGCTHSIVEPGKLHVLDSIGHGIEDRYKIDKAMVNTWMFLNTYEYIWFGFVYHCC